MRFLLRSFSSLFRIAWSFVSNCARIDNVTECRIGHTSSRFDIFALLALNEDVALSLCAVSNFGLGIGMLDGLSEELVWALPFGVPLYVPAADMVGGIPARRYSCYFATYWSTNW